MWQNGAEGARECAAYCGAASAALPLAFVIHTSVAAHLGFSFRLDVASWRTGVGLTLAGRQEARRLNVNYWGNKITAIVECLAGEHAVGVSTNAIIEEEEKK